MANVAGNTRREIARLGSERESEREAASTYFFLLGEEARPVLYKALWGPVRSACGAAVTLDRMEDSGGIRRILRRAYEEEWLSRHLFRAGRNSVRRPVLAALRDREPGISPRP